MAHTNKTDIGIPPGKGLVPPKIHSREIETDGKHTVVCVWRLCV